MCLFGVGALTQNFRPSGPQEYVELWLGHHSTCFFLGGGLGLKLSIGAKEETNREIIGALQKSRCWQVKV